MRGFGSPRTVECFHVDSPDSHFVIQQQPQSARNDDTIFVERISIPMDPSDEISYRRIWGCLGAITLNNATLVAFISEASPIAALSLETGTSPQQIARITDVTFVPLSATYDPLASAPTEGLKKLLTNGNFYFAVDESDETKAAYASDFDRQFVWNTYLRRPFAGASPFLRHVWQGHFGATSFFTDTGERATMILISRLSAARAGTRLKSRGVDDDGNVANFCETRTILSTPASVIAFTQVRGSVPVFWEETSTAAVSTKITVTRPQVASMSAFEKHFRRLISRYDRTVNVNLLSDRGQEAALKIAYRDHCAKLNETDPDLAAQIRYEELDFHALNALSPVALHDALSQLLTRHSDSLDPRVTMPQEGSSSPVLLHQQQGVFRTNCKDCLDRTNVVQEVMSREAIRRGLELSERPMDAATQQVHRDMFAANGDTLSKLYTGTAALSSAITKTGKKGDWKALLNDAGRSVGRLYQNTFLDSDKQEGLDVLLGLHRSLHSIESRIAHLPASDGELIDKTIWISTYNVEGRSPTSEIRQWLDLGRINPDVVFIGLQEVVALTARGVILPDEAKVAAWTSAVGEVLGELEDPFILIRSQSLVGTVALLLVRQSQLPFVRDVYASSKKTGMGGATGNKGAVAISFVYHRTTCCFVSAHLTAGQDKAAERSTEARGIRRELSFPYGFRVDDHEITAWAADMNYRCDVTYDEAIDLLDSSRRDELLERDQLRRAISSAFPDYEEGEISFNPTYKFDHDSDTYDTSEKRRIPSWTDRILFRQSALSTARSDSKRLQLQQYYSSNIRLSDHRPVCAEFRLIQTAPRSSTANGTPVVARPPKATNGTIDARPLGEPVKWLDTIDYSKLDKLGEAWKST